MSAAAEWARDVFTVILSITFLEIVLPEGSMKKYVKFIFSIFVMAILLSPLALLTHN